MNPKQNLKLVNKILSGKNAHPPKYPRTYLESICSSLSLVMAGSLMVTVLVSKIELFVKPWGLTNFVSVYDSKNAAGIAFDSVYKGADIVVW